MINELFSTSSVLVIILQKELLSKSTRYKIL